MARSQLHDEFFRTSRGRIVELLRRGPRTVDDLATNLGVTPNAVRAQLAAMEQDQLVRRAGSRPGATRPFHVFELTPAVEQLVSGAYIPLLTHIVRLLGTTQPERLDGLMREVGRALAADLVPRIRRPASFQARVTAASRILNDEFGAVTEVRRRNGVFVLEGDGCPLAALTENQPSVCLAVESLLGTILPDADVRECCVRRRRPRCCFQIRPA